MDQLKSERWKEAQGNEVKGTGTGEIFRIIITRSGAGIIRCRFEWILYGLEEGNI